MTPSPRKFAPAGGPLSRPAEAIRRIGPDPVLLAREAAYRGRRRIRDGWIRRNYAGVVAAPGSDAGFRALPIEVDAAATLPAPLVGPAQRIRSEADAVLRGEADVLGSGPVRLGAKPDWHADLKSGHVWPRAFYRDLEVTRLGDASDAKVPWELSRGHQLLALARAASLFREECYAAELGRQWSWWLEDNPAGIGINWANTMEVAIRATNWVWAMSTFEAWRPLDPALRRRLLRSLQVHARHIAWNPEGTPRLRSNHYLANVLGLLVLGATVEEPAAGRWFRRAHRAFEREIALQVHRDGTSFEASTGYHGLALEIFLLARWVATSAGRRFSTSFDDRLRCMLEVSRALRHPDGRMPRFGDWDDGRVLPATCERPPTHDHLLWLGAAVIGSPPPPSERGSEEVAWTLGTAAWSRSRAMPPKEIARSVAFPDGGHYVLREGVTHLVIRCGDVGQRGNGGHAHNDLLSYEVSLDGVVFVVDAGTYVYTADPGARNEFRSTWAHNTVVVDGEEINPIDPVRLFALRQLATPLVRNWEVGDDHTRFVGAHDGYRRLPARVVHEREFVASRSTGAVKITDLLAGRGRLAATALIHLAAGTRLRALEEGSFLLERNGVTVNLAIDGSVHEVRCARGWVSDRYGRRQEAPMIEVKVSGEAPLRLRHAFSHQPAGRG